MYFRDYVDEFINACRSLISLHGCHLKDLDDIQLLNEIVKNANNKVRCQNMDRI